MNLCDYELTILKSLKKGEVSRIEIDPILFVENKDKSFLYKLLKESTEKSDKNSYVDNINTLTTRISIEIELINFTENFKIKSKKGVEYERINILDGIGNVCPGKDFDAKLKFELRLDNKILYTNFETNSNIDEFCNEVLSIKSSITNITGYLKNLNNLIEKKTQSNKLFENSLIYDSIAFICPTEIYDSIKVMKLLEVIKLRLKSCDLIRIDVNNTFYNLNGNIEIKICLLNYSEKLFFQKFDYLANKGSCEMILHYKSIANFYFQVIYFLFSNIYSK